MAGQPPATGQWTTGLCGCFEDIYSCCCSCWCACVPVGQVANVVNNGTTSCFEGALIFLALQCCLGMGCLYTCSNRKKLRVAYGLPAEPCNDFCTDWCCLCCSVAQTYRELKNHGLDPSLGYPAAVGATLPSTAPPAGQFMQK